MLLKELPMGSRARLVGFAERGGAYRRKLLTLGLTPGVEIDVVRVAPNTILLDLIRNSAGGTVQMSEEVAEVFDIFHNFMFDAVYRNQTAKGEESKVKGILGGIFDHYIGHMDELPEEFQDIARTDGAERAVCDYVAGMTDGYAMEVYGRLFIPAAWSVK